MNRRDRTVIFRLTQEEFRRLQNVCAASGGRSLSDFTRSEILAAVQADSADASIRGKLLAMDRKLDDLLQTIRSGAGETSPPADPDKQS